MATLIIQPPIPAPLIISNNSDLNTLKPYTNGQTKEYLINNCLNLINSPYHAEAPAHIYVGNISASFKVEYYFQILIAYSNNTAPNIYYRTKYWAGQNPDGTYNYNWGQWYKIDSTIVNS